MPDVLDSQDQDTFANNLLDQGDYDADMEQSAQETRSPISSSVPRGTIVSTPQKSATVEEPPTWPQIQTLPNYQKASQQERQNVFNRWIGAMHYYGEANGYKPSEGEQDTINTWGAKQARDLGMASFIDPISGIVQPINTGQIKDSVDNFYKQAGITTGEGIAGIGHYIDKAKDFLSYLNGRSQMTPVQKQELTAKFGPDQSIEDAGKYIIAKAQQEPLNPIDTGSLERSISNFAGQSAPLIAGGEIGGPAMLAGEMSEQGGENAQAAGLSPARQEAVRGVDTVMGAAIGKLATIAPWLKEAEGNAAMKEALTQNPATTIFKSLARNAAQGGIAGFVQQIPEEGAMGQNPFSDENLAKNTENAETLAIGGGILGAGFKGMAIGTARSILNEQFKSENQERIDQGVAPISYPDYLKARIQAGQEKITRDSIDSAENDLEAKTLPIPPTDVPYNASIGESIAKSMAQKYSDEDLNKITNDLSEDKIQAALSASEEVARNIGASPNLSLEDKQEGIQRHNNFVKSVNDFLGSTQYFPIDENKVIDLDHTPETSNRTLNSYYEGNLHPATDSIIDSLDAYKNLTQYEAVRQGKAASTVPAFLQARVNILKDRMAKINPSLAKRTPVAELPTSGSPSTPLEAYNARQEDEIATPIEGSEKETTPISPADETMAATHPVFGEGEYRPTDLLGTMTTSDVAPGVQQLHWNDLPTDRVRRQTTDDKSKMQWQYDLATPTEAQNENFQRPQLTRDNLGQQDALLKQRVLNGTASAVGPATTEEVKNNDKVNENDEIQGNDETVSREAGRREQRPLLDETELGIGPSGDDAERGSTVSPSPSGIDGDDQARLPAPQQGGERSTARTSEANAQVTEGGGKEENPAPPPTNNETKASQSPEQTPTKPKPSEKGEEASQTAEKSENKGIAPVTYLGEQERADGSTFPLYQINKEIPELPGKKDSAVSGETLTKLGYDLPKEREGFKEDKGIFIDPEAELLPKDESTIYHSIAESLRNQGIKGVRLSLSAKDSGMWVDPQDGPRDTIHVNPRSLARVKENAPWIRAASSEEGWHLTHLKAVDVLGGKVGDTYQKIFEEMSPESVAALIRDYAPLSRLKGIAKGDLDASQRFQIAAEYLRILQMKNGGEKTAEDINGKTDRQSEQTKGILARDLEFINSSPTIVRILNKSIELDSVTRPDKYTDTDAKRPFSSSNAANPRDNAGDSGDGEAGGLQRGDENGGTRNPSIHAGLPKEASGTGEKDFLDRGKSLLASANGDIQKIKKYDDWTKAKTSLDANDQLRRQRNVEVAKWIEKAHPDPVVREGMYNFREAGGDLKVLKARADATKNPVLKKGYDTALNLTDAEKKTVADVGKMLDLKRDHGLKWGLDIGKAQNYVPHRWVDSLEDKASGQGNRRLNPYSGHTKGRTFETSFHGEQIGYKPATKDIGHVLVDYLDNIDSAINARQFIFNLAKGKDSHGEPLAVFDSGPELQHIYTPEGQERNQAIINRGKDLETPADIAEKYDKFKKANDDGLDALNNWIASGEVNGKKVYKRGDLRINPEIYPQLKNIFGTSEVKKWWNSPSDNPVEKVAKNIVWGAFKGVEIGKTSLFGLIPSFFHPVQLHNEQLSHRINPYTFNEINLNDPKEFRKARLGVKFVATQNSINLFKDGMDQSKDNVLFVAGKLLDKIPEIGPQLRQETLGRLQNATDATQKFIFETYLPALKGHFFDVVEGRNRARFSKELASGAYTDDDVGYLTARQTNAAFGHLNYTDIARNATFQHFMQFSLLAPDFFEARLRHTFQAGQGVLGGKGGWEMAQALAFMGASMYVGARVVNMSLNNGDPKWDEPFRVVVGNKAYGMRTQVGDLIGLFKNYRTWLAGRESPMLRFALQALTGVNYRGEATDLAETIKDTLAGSFPISAQWSERYLPGFLQSKTVKNNPISPFEQGLQAVGIQVSRYSPVTRTYELANQWKASHGSEFNLQPERGAYPTSQYTPLRYALEDGDYGKANQVFQQLVSERKNPAKIISGFRESLKSCFLGEGATNAAKNAFVQSLSPSDKQVYDAAVSRRQLLWQRFGEMREQAKP